MQQLQFIETILYVSDQQASTDFYTRLFRREPVLQVPGMTEFELAANCKLGLMPNHGIAKILGEQLPHPASGNGIPRCELYLLVADVALEYENALQCGAKLILEITAMDWGDSVCYFADPDGHVIAFAARRGH